MHTMRADFVCLPPQCFFADPVRIRTSEKFSLGRALAINDDRANVTINPTKWTDILVATGLTKSSGGESGWEFLEPCAEFLRAPRTNE